jgi:hypothetical protein
VDKHKLEFRFKFKIDDENILDYQHKYLKYKSKYLALKYGGDSKVNRVARDRSKWEPPKKPTTSFFSRFSLSGPKEEEYVRIEKEADLKERTNFKIGQQQTTAILNQQKKDNKEAIKTKNEKIANEEIRTENRTKLLKNLEEILNNIPYNKKLVNCKVNKCECCVCKQCVVGVNDINDIKEEKEWCKDGVFKNCRCEKKDKECICINGNEIPSFLSRINKKICPCINSNSNIILKSTMFGKEIYCPNNYKYTLDIKNLIEKEINSSNYDTTFDSNDFSKDDIKQLLKKPINQAYEKKYINSENELIKYIIKKLTNYMGEISLL